MEDRWSKEYLRRREMLATLEVPALSEAKLTAGLPLSLILFEECHQDLKVDFGLEPYLEGPRGDLWVSPSDLLIGKVALKPPLTQKHIQALTHQGIIELGAEVEQKFLNEMQMDKEKSLEEREAYLRKMFATELEETIKQMLKEEQIKHDQEMSEARRVFDNRVYQLVWECYEQVRALEEQMQVEVDSLNIIWQQQLELAVQETTQKITEEFLEKMRCQEHVLVGIFTKQIEILKMKKKCAVDFVEMKCKETLLQMKHKLHCHNISNLMYLLIKERRKCKNEKTAILNDYQKRLRIQKANVNKKSKMIQALLKAKNKKTRQLNVRERCLIEILRQFEKFIYFALKAAPTQGEFLLNIDKLIKFELHDFCLKKYEERPTKKQEATLESPEDKLIDSYAAASLASEPEEFLEISKSSPKGSGNAELLPAFYFNDKMYVREDFRDMFSAGIEIDDKSSLWNPDVEELLNIFRATIQAKKEGCQIDNVKSHTSVRFDSLKHSSKEDVIPCKPSVHSDKEKPYAKENGSSQLMTILAETASEMAGNSPLFPPSKKSSLIDDDTFEEKEIKRISLGGETSPSANNSKRNQKFAAVVKRERSRSRSIVLSDDVAPSPKRELQLESGTQSRLTLARDSLIIHISTIERKSLQYVTKLLEDKTSHTSSVKDNVADQEKVKDVLLAPWSEEEMEDESPIVKTVSQGSLNTEPKEPRHTSKLLLATDSIELIKSSMGVTNGKEKPAVPQQKPSSTLKLKESGTTLQTSAKKAKQTRTRQKPISKRATTTPRSTATKVVGFRKTKEHEKPIEVFTEERIKSLVNIMKENPSLIRLFTPCRQ